VDSVYACSNCRYESPFYLADCPECGQGFFNLKGAPQPAAAFAGAPAAPQGELRICYKCDHETREGGDRCPRCGNKRVLTPKAIRVLGGVLLGIGLFLVAFMGTITVVVAGIVAHSNDPNATSRFEGGTKELAIIFGLFALVIAFGATSAVAGAVQLARGRRSKTMVRVILGIFVALVVVAELIYVVLD
jgi:uncharacterized membrane protein YphA (DoxX/SURF4 family)